MRNTKKIVENSLYLIVFLLPFFVIYLLLFYMSMETARDRFEYLKMMQNPFVGREEIGISIYSYFTGFFLESPILKLILFQVIAISLVFFTIALRSKTNTLLKFYLCVLASMLLFNVYFGTQLRVGFASVLLAFISLGLNKDAKLVNLFWYLVPCLFHLAVVPAVLFLYLLYYLKIKDLKFYLFIYLFMLLFIVLGSAFLEDIILFFGLNAYYLSYLSEDAHYQMRSLPFSFIFYLLVVFFIFFNIRRFDLSYRFWMVPSGLLFSFAALIADQPFLHKFMGVFFFYTIVYLILNISFSKNNEKILLFFVYFLIPFGFAYFAKSVFLI